LLHGYLEGGIESLFTTLESEGTKGFSAPRPALRQLLDTHFGFRSGDSQAWRLGSGSVTPARDGHLPCSRTPPRTCARGTGRPKGVLSPTSVALLWWRALGVVSSAFL